MNPYAIIIALLAWFGSMLYAYRLGGQHKHDEIVASQQATRDLIDQVKVEAQMGAASAIADIKIRQTTIQGRVEHEIQTNTVYRDCEHTDASLRDINAALTNQAVGPAGSGLKLPDANATGGQVVRGDDKKAP
jgi:hypothetical protein